MVPDRANLPSEPGLSYPAVTIRSVIARVSSAALVGMEARPVEVEVDLGSALRSFSIVGLPSAAVREAAKRVESAILNSQAPWPTRRITASLAPSDLRKEGSLLDLAIAIGILVAAGNLRNHLVSRYWLLGELALDGRLRPVRGALSAAMGAKEAGAEGIVVPRANASEASLVSGVRVVGVATLLEAMAFLEGKLEPDVIAPPGERLLNAGLDEGPDLREVRGQALARRALEIAAAGGHNLLLIGPPGAGKTMLARRLPSILPPLKLEEALEVTRIWSIAGLLPPGQPMVTHRPFRAPHHHATAAAVIGGGSPALRPGEVSLAHRGVLFLDEIALFSRAVLDGLREPLEDGEVTIARQRGTVRFPAQVSLIAAANPCPCGRLNAREQCRCTPGRVESYRMRLSGPLLDRFDLFADVPRLSEAELLELDPSEPSAAVRARVEAARLNRRHREASAPKVPDTEMVRFLDSSCRAFLRQAFAREPGSARAFHRVIRVARTIADLDGCEGIEEAHLAESLQFRRVIWD